jgi:hypothetical protein
MTIARAGTIAIGSTTSSNGFDAEPTWTRLDLAVVHTIRRFVALLRHRNGARPP